MICPECEVVEGQSHDTFCSLASCKETGKPWLTCTRGGGKKHHTSLVVSAPDALGASMSRTPMVR